MTAEQWSIVKAAYYSPGKTYGLEPASIKKLFNAGEGGQVPEGEVIWLRAVGKRYGIVPWESKQEKENHMRFHRTASSGGLVPSWKRNSARKPR